MWAKTQQNGIQLMKYWNSLIKKSIALMLAMQGVVVSQEIIHVNVKDIEVPVIFEQSTSLPIVSMQLVFGAAGSIQDGAHPGLARFSATLLNEGTKSLGAVGFAKELEQRAISLSVHAGTETLVFELGSLKESFEYGLQKLQALINEPNLTKGSFEKVRTMTLGSLSRKMNDYDYVAGVALNGLLYEGTSLANPALGTPESIQKLTLEKVSEYINTSLDLSNAIVVIGGDISESEAIKYATEVLNHLKIGSSRKLLHVKPTSAAKSLILDKPSEQAYIYFGSPFEMDANDPDQYKARVAAFILGESGFGSRLMEEIRVKRGLAYSAYGRVSINRSSSKFSGYLQTKNANKTDAIKIIKEVIADFVKNGATKEELDQAKRFLLGSEPLRTETLSQRLSRAFMEYYRGFESGYYAKQLTLIEELDLKTLNKFIASHPELNDLSIAVVTDVNASQ
jgi:predicted Zn-dependent peptidase